MFGTIIPSVMSQADPLPRTRDPRREIVTKSSTASDLSPSISHTSIDFTRRWQSARTPQLITTPLATISRLGA